MVKVIKALRYRHGRRGKDGCMDFGQPFGRQGLADINALGSH